MVLKLLGIIAAHLSLPLFAPGTGRTNEGVAFVPKESGRFGLNERRGTLVDVGL
jgi:hypothetical protein